MTAFRDKTSVFFQIVMYDLITEVRTMPCGDVAAAALWADERRKRQPGLVTPAGDSLHGRSGNKNLTLTYSAYIYYLFLCDMYYSTVPQWMYIDRIVEIIIVGLIKHKQQVCRQVTSYTHIQRPAIHASVMMLLCAGGSCDKSGRKKKLSSIQQATTRSPKAAMQIF